MKKSATLVLFALMAGSAHAATFCNINSSSNGNNEFDRILIREEIGGAKYVVVNKTAQSAKSVDFKAMDSYEKWRAIDGSTLVSFIKQENGSVLIAMAHVKAKRTGNLAPVFAMAVGHTGPEGYLQLLANKLSVICLEQ